MVRMPGSCAQDITEGKREYPKKEVPVDRGLEDPVTTGAAMDRQETKGSSLADLVLPK